MRDWTRAYKHCSYYTRGVVNNIIINATEGGRGPCKKNTKPNNKNNNGGTELMKMNVSKSDSLWGGTTSHP